MICDWCGKNYHNTLLSKQDRHILEDYVLKPVICDDCYSKLKTTQLTQCQHIKA